MSVDELNFINSLVTRVNDFTRDKLITNYAHNKRYHDSMLGTIYKDQNLDWDNITTLEQVFSHICHGMIGYINEFANVEIGTRDAITITTKNHEPMLTFTYSIYLNEIDSAEVRKLAPSQPDFDHLVILQQILLQVRTKLAQIMATRAMNDETLKPAVANLAQFHGQPLSPARKGLTYEKIFRSPWAMDQEMERQHLEVSRQMARWHPRESPFHPFDYVPHFLWLFVMLCATDNLKPGDLRQPGVVEEMQVNKK